MNLADALRGIDHHLWSSEPDVAAFLACLVKMHRLEAVVEVGVFKGLTASHLIDSLPPGGRYVGIDIEDHRCESVKAFMCDQGQGFHLGDSKRELERLPSASAGLVFLDGDHTLEYVKQEFLESLRILKPGGFICIHDYHAPGVRLWVNYVRRFRSFDAIVFNTSENRGLAIIVPKKGPGSAGWWFKAWFAISRNRTMVRLHERYRSLRSRVGL